MSNKQKPTGSAVLAERLMTDPEFLARQHESDHRLAERAAQFQSEQRPLIVDLQAVGVSVRLVSDLINTSEKYGRAVPVLLKHLQLPYSDGTRETIARSLAIREARSAWPILVDEYVRTPATLDGKRSGTKEGLAAALSATTTKETIGDLAELAKDRSHGISRVLLLSALKRSKNPAAISALDELKNDPDLEKEIASWGRR